MKKICSSLFALIFFISAAFAGKMDDRYFEVRVDVPAHVSNNVVHLLDLFQSDEYIIDFAQVADELPDEGFVLSTSIAPELKIDIDVPGFYLGLNFNLDVYGSASLDKSLFRFLGYGNDLGEVITVNPSIYCESFFSFGPDIGFNIGDLAVRVNPELFIPLFVVDSNNSYLEFENTSDGNFKVDLKGNVVAYSQFGIDSSSEIGLNLTKINSGSGDVSLTNSDAEKLALTLFNVAGFDISGSFQIPVFTSKMCALVSARVPVISGKMHTKTYFTVDKPIETSLNEMIDNDFDMEKTIGNFEWDYSSETVDYEIHRPLKLNGYVIYKPFKFITLKGGGGIGVRNPLGDSSKVYPEYYFSGDISVLGGAFKCSLSTEYTNQVYSHTALFGISARIVEVDMALGLESSTFSESFNISGLNFALGIAMGF